MLGISDETRELAAGDWRRCWKLSAGDWRQWWRRSGWGLENDARDFAMVIGDNVGDLVDGDWRHRKRL